MGTSVYALRRVRLIDGIPCSIETVFVTMERCAGIEQHDFSREPLFDVLRWEYGIKAVSGDEKISVTTLDADEAELLEKAEDADLVYINDILPAKMEYNLKSVKEFGFFKDIGVLFKTVAAVF